MKHLLYSITFLLIAISGFGQAPLVKQWDYRYGGSGGDYFHAIISTSDAGYLLGGMSQSGISGDHTQSNQGFNDFWIVKLDSQGLKQWDKGFGGSGYEGIISMAQTHDGGYILGGSSTSGISGDKTENSRGGDDFWIVKTDSAGNKLWDKRFGGALAERMQSVKETTDGGYILGGYSNSSPGGDRTEALRGGFDFWVVKTDSAGNKLWDKRFGGTGDDLLRSLQKTSDGGYILGGESDSDIGGDKSESNRGWDDYWMVKIDSAGIKQWDKRFGGDSYESFSTIEQTVDGGYYLAGDTRTYMNGDKTQPAWGGNGDYDWWVVKTDSAGNKLWDRRYGGDGFENDFGNAFQTSDGGFLLSGVSFSSASGDKSENNLGIAQGWIVKTDANGNRLWDKTIFTVGNDPAGYVVETSDGCYAIANHINADTGGYKTQASQGYFDYWIVKFCVECNLAAQVITADQSHICANDSAQICASTGYAYQWNTGETSVCIKTQLAGNYYVTVTDNFGCTAESNRIAITVLQLPPTSISVNGDTLSVHGATTQQWYLNGTAITGATANIYIATQGGSYTVMVTDSNGCSATSSPVIISGIENISEEDIVSVYPNPLTVGGWQLTVGNSFIGGKAEVFDADGRVVFQSEIRNPQSEIAPDVPKGVYLLRITSGKSSVVRRLVRL